MKIPAEVRIGKSTWHVRKVTRCPGQEQCVKRIAGLCDFETKTIYILKGLGKKRTMETFIHEIMHAIGFTYAIPELMKEELISLVERPLTKFVMDNF